MRVIFDTTSVSNETQSSYRYFSELIPRFRKRDDLKLEIIPSPYFDTPKEWLEAEKIYKPLLPSGKWLPLGPVRKSLSKLKWSIEKKYLQRKLSKNEEPAIYHSFLYTLPPSDGVIFVPNALDLILEKHGEALGMGEAAAKIFPQKKACFERADRILAISENTKNDLSEIYSISKEKIDVVHLAVNERIFGTKAGNEDIVKTHLKYGIQGPFLLQVGGRLHHRNFLNLLKAYGGSNLKKEVLLVAAGSPWQKEEIEVMKALGVEGRVLLAEQPSDIDLRNLYQSAEMLVYPSLYEGFGFPIVEAMMAGLPVATSFGSGSIPEVAGEAALYFDPKDPEDIARKIFTLLDPKVQADHAEKGLRNVSRFSWDETARKTLESYARALSSNA